MKEQVMTPRNEKGYKMKKALLQYWLYILRNKSEIIFTRKVYAFNHLISQSHLQRILKEYTIKPYKRIDDDALRLDFCLWLGENQSVIRISAKTVKLKSV